MGHFVRFHPVTATSTDFKIACNSIKIQVFHNIFTENGIPTKLSMLIKRCLNKIYGYAQLGKAKIIRRD
jgi:hypothetical protein